MNLRTGKIAIAVIVLIFFNIIVPSSCVIASFGDYTFVSDTTITSNSWSFHLDVKDDQWNTPDDGLVLSRRFYDVNASYPVNYISPVDILFGSGVVARDPGRFNFSYTWGDRYVNVSFQALPGEIDIVLSSIGNVHCIARTNETYEEIISVEIGDRIKLSGYLVDVTGNNGSSIITWETDTHFGNEQCEILVISNVVPVYPVYIDVSAVILLFIIVGAGIFVFFYARKMYCSDGSRSQKRACKIVDRGTR